jgi:hypothetical protein
MDVGPICAGSELVSVLVCGAESQKSSTQAAAAMVGKGVCPHRSRSPVVPHIPQL